MSLELYNRVGDAAIDTFTPGDHLLGIVQRVVASRTDKRVVLPGKGEVVILPDRGVYSANVQDMAEFCSAPSAQFITMACGEDAPDYSSSGRIINELLWNAAFHASQGRLIEGCSLRDFVQFRHWPNLTRLPVTPNTARICALLTRRRTVIAMVHQHLAINNEEVCQIYSAAYCAGISNAINSALAKFKIGADDPRLAPERKHSLFRSLFGKIAGL